MRDAGPPTRGRRAARRCPGAGARPRRRRGAGRRASPAGLRPHTREDPASSSACAAGLSHDTEDAHASSRRAVEASACVVMTRSLPPMPSAFAGETIEASAAPSPRSHLPSPACSSARRPPRAGSPRSTSHIRRQSKSQAWRRGRGAERSALARVATRAASLLGQSLFVRQDQEPRFAMEHNLIEHARPASPRPSQPRAITSSAEYGPPSRSLVMADDIARLDELGHIAAVDRAPLLRPAASAGSHTALFRADHRPTNPRTHRLDGVGARDCADEAVGQTSRV